MTKSLLNRHASLGIHHFYCEIKKYLPYIKILPCIVTICDSQIMIKLLNNSLFRLDLPMPTARCVQQKLSR